MEMAVVVIVNGAIVIYKSDNRTKLRNEVLKAKEKGYPYAVLRPEHCLTTF